MQPDHFYHHMYIKSPWAPEITVFKYNEVILIKVFINPINTEALAAHFNFTYLFQQGLFSTWPLLFTPGVFWFKYKHSQDFNFEYNLCSIIANYKCLAIHWQMIMSFCNWECFSLYVCKILWYLAEYDINYVYS